MSTCLAFNHLCTDLATSSGPLSERRQTGRWKVFSHLEDWLEEFRLYHRKDGKVVKVLEDLISASRYAMMMKRLARPSASAPIPQRSKKWVI